MPSHWARVLRRCLETDPERRYSRPDEMAKALRRRRDPRSLIAIAGVAALVGALAVVLVNRGESPAGTQNRRLFATESGLQVWSSSPDGSSVAATEFPSESLILKDVRSGKVRRVAPGREAIFSPDGKRLAYVWYPSRTESELRVIGVDGTGQRTLYRDPEVHPTPVDWSPDGRRILVRIFAHDTTDRLAVVSVENATLQLLPLDDRARFGSAIFAQDGIGVVVDNGGEIRRFTANGSGSTLVGKPGSKRLIGWSPDRRDLIFLSDRKGRMGIWAVSVVNDQVGEPREVAPNVGDWESLGVTRTGALLYRSDANAVDVYTATLDLADGRTVSPPKRVMDQFVGTYAYPNWSDDGRWLIFDSRHRPGVVGIYDLTTGARRELQTDLQMLMRPQWLSHGSAIMLVGLAQDRQEGQFRIDPATGKATLFMTRKELGALYEGVWSPDGKTYFNRYMDWRRGIFRLDAQTRERTVIYVPPSGVDLGLENLTLSPDGHTLAFHARNDGEKSASLMLIPAAGGNARPLLTIHAPEQFLYGAFTWTPDSRRLLTTRTKNGVSEIWQVPVDGSPPTKIDFPPMRILSLRLSHDGKTIAFSKTEFRSEIWMLQNFL